MRKNLTTKQTIELAGWLGKNAELLKLEYSPKVAEVAEQQLSFPVSVKSVLHLAKDLELLTRRDLERAVTRTRSSEPQLFDAAAIERLDRLERLTVRIAHHLNLQHLIKETTK